MANQLVKDMEQLNLIMTALVEKWRMDDDSFGVDSFNHFIEQLECVIDVYPELLTTEPITILSPILEDMYVSVKNKNILEITDLVAYRLQPFMLDWERGMILNANKSE